MHPFSHCDGGRVCVTIQIRNIFSDSDPTPDAKAVRPVIHHLTVRTAVAEEAFVGHVLRMKPGEPGERFVPFKQPQATCLPLRVRELKGTAFEVACSRPRACVPRHFPRNTLGDRTTASYGVNEDCARNATVAGLRHCDGAGEENDSGERKGGNSQDNLTSAAGRSLSELSALRPRTVPFAVAFSDKVLRRNFKNVSCAGRHK